MAMDWVNLSNSDASSSTMSLESSGYTRTASDLSTYSETNCRHNIFSKPSPGWPDSRNLARSPARLSRSRMKQHADILDDDDEAELELEMMKEKLSKLLLGEDMSGGGKGVCTALAISNAITNLYATVFGQFKRLEPLSPEKKSLWRRETDCLLSICDFIEDLPSSHVMPDGTVEARKDKPRQDICMSLPALRKLDAMLLEILDSFHDTEFWYTEKENTEKGNNFGSFGRARNEDKWWLPVPCVPPRGLSEKSRKQLQHKRECANQMHKAARSINSTILAEMEVPETYMATLPKCGRAGVGDAAYRYMSTAEQFSPDYFLNCLEIKSEHEGLEVADRIEASMCVWRRKASMQSSKSSWNVKDLVADESKNETLASKAESILLCLKQRYPQMPQTTLDTCRIQYNKDVGQAVLESYSRVLESLAFNVASRIEDVLYTDESLKNLVSINCAISR